MIVDTPVDAAIRHHVEAFGYAHLPRRFSEAEMAPITVAFDAALSDVMARDAVADPVVVSMIPLTVLDSVFLDLLDDDRVTGLADALLGEDCVYLGISNGMRWNRPSAWHPDTSALGRQDLKIVLYLDAVDQESGCLTVAPGSHHPEYHHALRHAFDSGLLETRSRVCPGAVALPSRPGDVQVFHRSVWHSTWGPAWPRRQISFNFHAAPRTSEYSTTRWEDAYLAGLAAKFRTWQAGYQLYEAGFVESAGKRRKRKIQPLLDLGFADSRRPCVTRETVISSAPLERS